MSGRIWSAATLATLAMVVCLVVLGACGADGGDPERAAMARALTGGEPERGRAHLQRYGCGTCHTIQGVPGADGLVGPPLTGVASRIYLAGVLVNTPRNMVRWIMDPRAVDPLTAMPPLGVSEGEARDIAAYLHALP